MKLLLLIPILLLTACSPVEHTRTVQRERPVCDEATAEARGSFILQCVRDGASTDDDDNDDVVRACRYAAQETYCPTKTVGIVQRCSPFFGLCEWITIHVDRGELVNTNTNSVWNN